jgi:FlaA1/EpsC-like NDP-sugar epimerase
MLPNTLIRFRRPLIVAAHLLLIPLAYRLAFTLRFDWAMPETIRPLFWATLPYLMGGRLLAFGIFGLFQGWWRHVGMRDLIDLVQAVTLSSALLLMALFFGDGLEGFPRSLLALDWITSILVFGGLRFAVRAFREERFIPWKARHGKRTLIIGAGISGERLVRESQRDGGAEVYPLALLDDDLAKRGMRLHGIPVLGTTGEISEVAAKIDAQLLVIAIPSATREEMRRIVDACLNTGIEFKIVPSMRELIQGKARVTELRSVQIEDLLGRETVEFALEGPLTGIQGRTVMVTGGAGSIGSELARQIARFGPSRLVILDQAESPLYFINMELTEANPGLPVVAVVADVTDQARIERVFDQYRPEYVFHAAAYKHVPLMEGNPVEAVRNNVLGTLSVAQSAARFGAARFVLISTDKAVYPSSVMGATKRVAEEIVLGWPALRESKTDFRAVRFGNVLGSDGSVIPLFKRQLAAGQPLTVTHPEVTRYFMTIPEAVQLVLQAAALPEAERRICMLEMGEPVRIVDLAENLIRLSGLEPYRDVPIRFTGLRPGEKLHEELMSRREGTVPTAVEKILIVQTTEPDVDALTQGLDKLGAAAALGNQEDCIAGLCQLVPECVSPLRERGMERAALR